MRLHSTGRAHAARSSSAPDDAIPKDAHPGSGFAQPIFRPPRGVDGRLIPASARRAARRRMLCEVGLGSEGRGISSEGIADGGRCHLVSAVAGSGRVAAMRAGRIGSTHGSETRMTGCSRSGAAGSPSRACWLRSAFLAAVSRARPHRPASCASSMLRSVLRTPSGSVPSRSAKATSSRSPTSCAACAALHRGRTA